MHSIFNHQRQKQESLSFILYLDIKNVFNAINHRAIFSILEACGFPAADVALLLSRYTGSFLVMNVRNKFGKSTTMTIQWSNVRSAAQPPDILHSTQPYPGPQILKA